MEDDHDDAPDEESAAELRKIHDALLRLLRLFAERVARGLPKKLDENGV